MSIKKQSRLTLVGAALVGLLAGADRASAHHGAAAYEAPLTTPLTTLTATVTGFDWRNPHALIHFDVTDDTGAIAAWTAETAGLVILVRAGWHREVLKPGDRITVVGRRALNGTHAMLLQRLTFSDGRTLNSFIPPR